MAVDVTVKGSPGWWMHRLADQLHRARPRFDALNDRWTGNPPDTITDPNMLKYWDIVRESRTNFARLSVEARRMRMQWRGVRTSLDGDIAGDEVAWNLVTRCGLHVELGTLLRLTFTMGIGYTVVGLDDDDLPVATVRDPRDVTHAPSAFHPTRPAAALELVHDDEDDVDMAVLYLPGVKYVATRDRRAPRPGVRVRWAAPAYTIDPDLTETWDEALGVPVVPWTTEDGEGVFEPHLGLLDRIDKGTFRRDTIALLQAFRQRALVDTASDEYEDLTAAGPDDDVTVDGGLEDVLRADPGAVWTLPRGVQLWESGQVDLTPLQTSKRDDVKEFSAVTFTPLSMVAPDAAAAQSAEGASLLREGLVFAVEDAIRRSDGPAARVVSLLLAMAGEDQRADLPGIVVEWAPVERFSLSERGAAAVAAQQAGMPWRSRMSEVWGFGPERVARMEAERAADLLYQATVATPATPVTVETPPGVPSPTDPTTEGAAA